jgi:hypothetical protein
MNKHKTVHSSRLAQRGLATVALCLAALLPQWSAANVLVNGDFENEPSFGSGVAGNGGFSALTGSQIPDWVIEPGHAVTVHNTLLYPTISGSYSVNMDGEGFQGVNADLHQDFSSTSGDAYSLQYDWSTWQFSSAPQLNVSIVDTVTAAILYTGAFAGSSDSSIHHVTAAFTGTGNTLSLRLRELPQSGFNDNTFMVDNFDVSAVPEVTTALELAAGLLMLGALSQRRRPG